LAVVVSFGLMFAFAIAVGIYTKTWNVIPGLVSTVMNEPVLLALVVGFVALVGYGWSLTYRPSKATPAEQPESLTEHPSSESARNS